MKRYINIKNNNEVETVDEFDFNTREERVELIRCLREYQRSDSYNQYYSSSRCTKEWRERA